MRILYIAPVRDFSGYANAARGYIRALHQAGADLVIRPIRYDRADSGSEYLPTDLEKELLRKPVNDVDMVIQHLTPNEMRPVEGKVNVAITAWETTRIPDYWARKLNKFDAVMTFCDASVKAFVDSGVTVPVIKVPHTFDMSTYNLDDTEVIASPGDPAFLQDKFIFYNISQFSSKKGIDVLLRSYFAAFHGRKEDVLLIFKTYIDMTDRHQEQERLKNYIDSAKSAMRLAPDGYPNVMLVTKTLSDEQIRRVHKTADCYVCSSRAEGWCIPAFEALAYGNKLVTTEWGGMGEYTRERKMSGTAMRAGVYPVTHTMEPLVGQNHGDPDMYTAKDFVAEPSVSSMMGMLRAAYDERDVRNEVDLDEFDYSVVGPDMLEELQQVAANKTAVKEEVTNV